MRKLKTTYTEVSVTVTMCGVSYGTVTSSIVFPISKMPNALKRSFYFKNQVSDAFKIHFEPMGRSSGKSLMEAQV